MEQGGGYERSRKIMALASLDAVLEPMPMIVQLMTDQNLQVSSIMSAPFAVCQQNTNRTHGMYA